MKRWPIAVIIGLSLYWVMSMRSRRHEETWQPVPMAKLSAGPAELSAPSDSAAPSTPELHSVRAKAADFRLGRANAFFDEKKFLNEIAPTAKDAEAVIGSLMEWLRDPSDLQRLDGKKNFISEPPIVVLDRMTGLDLVEALGRVRSKAEAELALEMISSDELPKDVPETVRKVLLAEKYDALTGLARLSPNKAKEAFAKMPPARKKVLSAALVAGLVDAGWSKEEALKAAE